MNEPEVRYVRGGHAEMAITLFRARTGVGRYCAKCEVRRLTRFQDKLEAEHGQASGQPGQPG